MAYATLQQLRRLVGVTTTQDDDLLGDLLARAQGEFEGATGRKFEASANTLRRFDAVRDVDGPTLWLDHDCAEVASITNGDGTAVSAGQYVLEPRNATPIYAIRLLGSSGVGWTYTTDPEQAIIVSGKWAYSATAPLDVAQAVLDLAKYYYRRKDNEGEQERTLVFENGTMALPSDVPKSVQRTVRRYGRRV